MTLPSPIDMLDTHYARELGCTPKDLNSRGIVVVRSEKREIRFARGWPLAVYALIKTDCAVVSVRPDLVQVVEEAFGEAKSLDDAACEAIITAISPLVNLKLSFSGQRLYCDWISFRDRSFGDVKITTFEDEHSRFLHEKWGGEVFGQVVDGGVVSWAAVKPLAGTAWDLSIETLSDYRGRGYARSVSSAAVKYILDNGRIAAWGTDRTNTASLKTAYSVGFLNYCLDFGCVERV